MTIYENNPKKKAGLVSNANTHIDTVSNIRHSFLEIIRSFLINNTINHIVRNSSMNENDVS